MRNMLEELYFGNINPNDQTFIRDSAYGKAVQTMSENEDKLIELLDGKQKKLFLDLVNAQGTVNGTTAVENYINGFRLGAKIALEIMSDEDGCLRDIT